jgi:hypothetical protein
MMSEKPPTDDHGIEIVVHRTRESYRPLPPSLPAQRDVPVVSPPPVRPTLAERIDKLFEQHGPKNVGGQDNLQKFALLPARAQRELLRGQQAVNSGDFSSAPARRPAGS